jgi:hypothetical protein
MVTSFFQPLSVHSFLPFTFERPIQRIPFLFSVECGLTLFEFAQLYGVQIFSIQPCVGCHLTDFFTVLFAQSFQCVFCSSLRLSPEKRSTLSLIPEPCIKLSPGANPRLCCPNSCCPRNKISASIAKYISDGGYKSLLRE